MTPKEAGVLLALLRCLDGSQGLWTGLLPDLEALHASAAAAFRGGALPVDIQVIAEVLGEVARLHEDGLCWGDEPDDDEPARSVETVETGGAL